MIVIVSIASIIVVAIAERLLPYRRDWNRPQGDLAVDAAHLPITAGVNAAIEPTVAAIGAFIGVSGVLKLKMYSASPTAGRS